MNAHRFRKCLTPLVHGLLLSSAPMLTLAACAPLTRTVGISTQPAACLEFRPIQFSRLNDTEQTIAAVKAHNAVWDKLCGRR